MAIVAAVAVIGAGCGGKSNKSSAATGASSSPAATTAATTTAPASTTLARGALSGTWTGRYSGASQGTFVLSWQQSGSSLNGTIKLSTSGYTLPIKGALQGSAIRFGTVGSTAITYTGSVSGSSMSGSYRAPNDGGSWSANQRP